MSVSLLATGRTQYFIIADRAETDRDTQIDYTNKNMSYNTIKRLVNSTPSVDIYQSKGNQGK